MTSEAAQEREAVVRWLRERSAERYGNTPAHEVIKNIANAIEQGQHIKETDDV